MTLRLKGSNSGDVSLKAPATAGDNTITLPTSNGSADQFLKNSGTAGELEFSSMVEDSSGNVGIGKTSSGNKLEIEGQGATKVVIDARTDAANGSSASLELWSKNGSGTNNFGQIEYDGDGSFIIGSAGSGGGGVPITFRHGSTERARIDTSGRLLIGTAGEDAFASNANAKLQVRATSDAPQIVLGRNDTTATTNETLGILSWYGNDGGSYQECASVRAVVDANHANDDKPTRLVFFTCGDNTATLSERFRLDNSGRVHAYGAYDTTTSSAANVNVASDGILRRSTSSAKYKTNIETLSDSFSDALLACRPVWYRSTCEGDNPDHSWWGFIAEEVAEIDPRLVHWKTTEITYDENGSAVESPCDPEPEGVAYDRFVPHLLSLIKRQKTRIETLETQNTAQQAQIDDLLARVTALEAA